MAKRGRGGLWGAAAALAAVTYFCVHALSGDAGLPVWLETRRALATLELERAELAAERAYLEDRIARLSEATLDLDYLEERARAIVFAAHPDDVMIPHTALKAVYAPPTVDVDERRPYTYRVVSPH